MNSLLTYLRLKLKCGIQTSYVKLILTCKGCGQDHQALP